MTMLSRILVPVAFSERCQDATRYAAALACHFHCDLILLHVVVPPFAAFGSPEGYATPAPDLTEIVSQAGAQLEEFLRDELQELPVQRVVCQGDPAGAIAEYARSEECSLIVMPTHGYGPFRRFLLGSVTAKVLHDAPCPVWTGPHLEHPPALDSPRFQKILCAVDLGVQSHAVLEWASRFAAEFGSDLEVVHALPISTVRSGGFYFDPEWREDMAAAAREQIASLENTLQVKAPIRIEVGEVPGAVSAAAQAHGSDLLVIGRGHTHGVLGRLRTNAYAILRESPCPVVAI